MHDTNQQPYHQNVYRMEEGNYQWWMLLMKYVDKQISPEEEAELRRQMDSSIYKREQFEKVTAADHFQKILADLVTVDNESDRKRFAEKLKQQLNTGDTDHATNKTSTPSATKKTIFVVALLGAVAAMFLLIFKSAIFSYTPTTHQTPYAGTVMNHSPEEPIIKPYSYIQLKDGNEIKYTALSDGVLLDSSGIVVSKIRDTISIDTNNTYQEDQPLSLYLVTAAKTLQSVKLPNGILFTLDAASYLGYNPGKSNHNRAVRIYGQAYCEIDPKAKVHFTVLLNENLEVGVTGTKFNVRSYKNENPTVALKKGKVTLKSGELTYTMRTGEEVEFTRDKQFKTIKNAKIENELSWMDRALVFDKKNIYHIMHQIGTYYNHPVQFVDSIPPDQLSSGKISLEDNIEIVHSSIAFLYQVRIGLRNDTVIVSKNNPVK